MNTHTLLDTRTLRQTFQGRLLAPGDAAYDETRRI
jgi:hypothetical protein